MGSLSENSLRFEFSNSSRENRSTYDTIYDPPHAQSPFAFDYNSLPIYQKVGLWIDSYGVPTTFTIGVVLNTLTAVVILQTELKRASPCLYFVALAITDNVFLVQKIIPWASRRLYDIYDVAGICQLTYYCNYLSTFLEWWFVVMLMTERVLHQYSSRRARKLCNPFRTKCSLITMSIFAIVFHLYLTWTSAVIKISNMDVCIIIPENAEDIVQLRKVDIVFAFILPSSLLILLITLSLHSILQGNGSVARRLSQREISRENHNASMRRQSAPKIELNSRKIYLTKFEARTFVKKVNVSLLAVTISLCLLIMCVPYDSLRTKLTMVNKATMKERHWLELLHGIYAFNFAYKGLLYLCFLPDFRLGLCRLLQVSVKSLSGRKEGIEMETSDV